MNVELQYLRERYANLSDEKLWELAHDGGLTDEARQVLSEEFRKRNLTSTHTQPPVENSSSFHDPFVRWIIGLLGIAVVYGAVNLVLVGAQKMWHHRDQIRFDQIKQQLNVEQPKIEQIKSDLRNIENTLDQSEVEMTNLRKQIESVEAKYPDGIPAALYNDYSHTIEQHNVRVSSYNVTLGQYNVLYEDYTVRIAQYNSQVEEVNALAKKIGTTWYVVPVPVPRSGGRSLANTRRTLR